MNKNFLGLSILLLMIFSCKKDEDNNNNTTNDDLVWEYVSAWGSGGTGNNQYNLITGMDVDAGGNQYISDLNLKRVQKISNTGNFITTWGSDGTQAGKFQNPYGVAATKNGSVWVADINPDCNTAPDCMDLAGIDFGACAAVLGTAVVNGQCTTVSGCSKIVNGVDYSDYFYFTVPSCAACIDVPKSRIQRFNSDGNFVSQHGRCGNADGEFSGPTAITTDKNNVVYVMDIYNQRIQKHDPQGQFISNWNYGVQYGDALDLAVDADGNVFALFVNLMFPQKNKMTVVKFNGSGTLLNTFTFEMDTTDGSFCNALAFDSKGNLHFGCDDAIRIFKPDGTFIKKWGNRGNNEGEILALAAMGFDSEDNLYIAGCSGNSNCRISKFKKKN